MLQTGSREEVRSQLPGDNHRELSGCDLFSIQQSQSKATVCWEADRRILPGSSRAACLLSFGRLRVKAGVVGGGREKRSKIKKRRQPSEMLSPF
jgi:hypothetical protein